MQKTLDKWPGSPGIHAIAHQLGIPASTLAGLRSGDLVAVPRPAETQASSFAVTLIYRKRGHRADAVKALAAAPAPNGGEDG